MAIQVNCPDCGRSCRFRDERAGEVVECKACGADIRLSKRTPNSGTVGQRKKQPQPQAKGSFQKLLLGGGVIAGVLIAILVFLFTRGEDALRADNQQTGEASDPAPVEAVSATADKAPPVIAPQGTEHQATSAPSSGPVRPPAGLAMGGSGFQTAQAEEGSNFLPAHDWKVSVDPSAEPSLGEFTEKFNVKLSGGFIMEEHVRYPDLPSPFVLIGGDGPGKEHRELWNLQTGAKVTTLKGVKITGRTVGLSTDGTLVGWFRHAAGSGGVNGGIEVYDIEAQKSLGAVPVDSQKLNVAQVAIPNKKRLLACSNVNRKIVSWKLPSGELEREIQLEDKGQPDPHWAFSPGGRYVAVVTNYLSREIQIFDLDSGAKAGTIAFEKPGPIIYGMAFSRNGTEFAVAYASPFENKAERFVIWKVEDGSIVSDFVVPNPENRKIDALHSKGSLQWFPDGQRLLYKGIYIVDRSSKSFVYALDKPAFEYQTGLTRRVLSDNVIVSWDGDHQKSNLHPLKIGADEIAQSKAVTQSGGQLFDAKLPPLTAFDRGRAKDQSEVGHDWQVTPDPAEGAVDLADTITMSADGRVCEMAFSRKDTGIVCVRMRESDGAPAIERLSSRPEVLMQLHGSSVRLRVLRSPAKGRTNWINVYDAIQKKLAKRIDIPFPCELMAVSPDGKKILVQAIDGDGRLDVFSTTDGQHEAACRPFQDESEQKDRGIATAIFVDHDTIAVSSRGDKLVAFKIPTCEPLYSSSDDGLVAISPGGKWIATCTSEDVHLRDAQTGEGRGTIATGAVGVLGHSFSPKGDRMAILVTGLKETELRIVDLATGGTSSIPLPQSFPPVMWVDENSVLLSAMPGQHGADHAMYLVDLTRNAVLWTYLYSPLDDLCFNERTFDGRFWIAGPIGKGDSRRMTALTLPDESIKRQLAERDFESRALVKPGTAVALSLTFAEPAEVKNFRSQAESIVEQRIQDNKLLVMEDAAIQLVVDISPSTSAGQMQVNMTSIGAGKVNRQDISVERRRVAIRLAYQQGGQTIWESKSEVGNDSFFVERIADGEAVQTALDKSMWERTLIALKIHLPPSYIFAAGTQGLGASRLTGRGPVPMK